MTNTVRDRANSMEVEQKDPLGLWRLPSTKELSGKSYSMRFMDGGCFELRLGDDEASFQSTLPGWPKEGRGPADVCRIRDGVYFIDIDTETPPCDGLTVILLANNGWALLIHQRRIVQNEPWNRGPDVVQDYRVAALMGYSQKGKIPHLTRELVGARHFLLCGPGNLYEQIYLNTKCFFGHHVHTTMAKGKAEFHHATYYKLDEELYLIGWREMDNAAALITVEDYANRKMTGKAFHPISPAVSISRPVGGEIYSSSEKLHYPWDQEPV